MSRINATEAQILFAQQMAKINPQENETIEDIPDQGPESDLQGKVQKWAKEHGFPCWHDRSRKKNEPGWPDCILFLKESRVVLIELKAEKGVFSEDQKRLRSQFAFLKHEYHKVKSYKHFLKIMAM